LAEDISKLLGAFRLSDIVLSVPHTTLRGTNRADTAPPTETKHAVDRHRPAGCLWLIRWSVDMETTLSSPHGVSFGRLAPSLGVQDISRSLQFYCGVLGFNKVFENGNPVGFVILKKDKAELHLSQNKNHKASLNNVAHLMVEDATEPPRESWRLVGLS